MAIAGPTTYHFWAPASAPEPDLWIDDGTHAVGTDTAEVRYNPFDLLARDGDAGFDLVAFNVYSGAPEFGESWFSDGANAIFARSGLPIVISEFGVRARIQGWSNLGGAGSFVPDDDATDDQIQRGAYYQSQLAQFYGLTHVVGANWHAWSDRYLAGDSAKQIDMGLVQCDDPDRGFTAGERWDELDDRIAAVNCTIMDLIAAATGL